MRQVKKIKLGNGLWQLCFTKYAVWRLTEISLGRSCVGQLAMILETSTRPTKGNTH